MYVVNFTDAAAATLRTAPVLTFDRLDVIVLDADTGKPIEAGNLAKLLVARDGLAVTGWRVAEAV